MARLSIVVCGAPLASRATDIVTAAEAAGWDVALSVTDAAQKWADAPEMNPASRHADALLVCPLTFNTANKWALGIADADWLTVLCEVVAAGKRVVAVPMVNETLWQHPAWENTLARLASAGVVLVDPATGDQAARPVPHGSGEGITRAFNPSWVLKLLS
jgi:phosphopantothenoylcysteine synthetase/decarboxylase